MNIQASCKAVLFSAAALMCITLCGKPFFPTGISNRTKDKISVARNDGRVVIKVIDYHEWDGQAVLPQFKLIPDTDYEFSCHVSAPDIKCFYVQAFLIKGKSRLRIESEENSSLQGRVTLKFNSIDFEKIEISLRNRCQETCVNKIFTVRDFYFGKVQNTPPEIKSRLQIVPQFNSAGIYLNNNISSVPEKFKAKLFYRKKDESNFHAALPVSYDWEEKTMRSSLVMLAEDTEYVFYIEVDDDGRKERIDGSFKTRSSNFPIAETVQLKEIPTEFKSGTKEGYIRYTAAEGVVLDGKNQKRAAIDLSNKKYIILDSLEIKGGRIEAINLKNAENIVIRNCNIYGFGRIGTHRPDIDGRYYEKTYSLNNDCGIRIFNSLRITVENCVIHSPRGNANSWFYTHPSGPNGIHAGDSKEIVLRGNDIFGSTFRRWNDAVESKGNGKLSGGIGSDAEIIGNYFAVCNDDGMELDGGQKNVRFMFNKVEDSLCGVSAAPCLLGPSYIMYNLFCGRGDAYFYKASGIKNNYSCAGTGTLYFIGNTILDYNDGIGGFSIRADEKRKMSRRFFKVYGRNNLVRTFGPLYSQGVFKKEFICDVKGDEMCQADCFINEEKGNFQLKKNSNAGAIQNNIRRLPLRNSDFELDTANLKFECSDGMVQKKTLSVTAKKECTLKIVKGGDFFKITPEKLTLKANEKKLIEVELIPEKMTLPARFVSAFSVRQTDGTSQAVLVECVTWNNEKLLAEARSKAVYGKITTLTADSVKVELPITENGNYYLFLRHKELQKLYYADMCINGTKSEKKMIRPPAGFKNMWCIISAPTYNGKPNRPIKLTAGTHTIILKGVEPKNITGIAATTCPDSFRLAPGK